MNKQNFIDYVKTVYPNMIEDFWFNNGELHFYKNEKHTESLEPYTCIKVNGKFTILTDF